MEILGSFADNGLMVCTLDDPPALAAHYRTQASRFCALAAIVPGAELKAELRATARMYEGFAEKLEKPARLTAGVRR
jgi:hypothetical protein